MKFFRYSLVGLIYYIISITTIIATEPSKINNY